MKNIFQMGFVNNSEGMLPYWDMVTFTQIFFFFTTGGGLLSYCDLDISKPNGEFPMRTAFYYSIHDTVD